jgi:hypothetical protein
MRIVKEDNQKGESMHTNRIKNYTIFLIAFIVCLLFSYYLGYKSNKNMLFNVENTVELIIYDTLSINTNVSFKEEKFIEFMPYVVTDTFRVNDTLFVNIPKTQREYRDSNYVAWVSGYNPRLDSLNIFQKNKIITNTVTNTVTKNVLKTSNWGFGVGVGISATNNGIYPALNIGFYRRINF